MEVGRGAKSCVTGTSDDASRRIAFLRLEIRTNLQSVSPGPWRSRSQLSLWNDHLTFAGHSNTFLMECIWTVACFSRDVFCIEYVLAGRFQRRKPTGFWRLPNSRTARQWNRWLMTSIDPDRLMVDQSATSCGDVHLSRQPVTAFPGRSCSPMRSLAPARIQGRRAQRSRFSCRWLFLTRFG
jgi:hypothetical protein